MIKFVLILITVVFVVTFGQLQLAQPCDPVICLPPNCRCSSSNIPGGLEAIDTPQFVLVSFSDGVNVLNIKTYRRLYNRSNTNRCRAGATFFVSHEYTDYQLVNELYNNGFEIALHSMSNQGQTDYWSQDSYNTFTKEFAYQIEQMSHFANIPIDDIKGVRIPSMQMVGNSSFQVMSVSGLLYDYTWGVINPSVSKPGLWPYTLDYASTQQCLIPPCPTASIPGSWVLPLIAWTDLLGYPCTVVNGCYKVPATNDEDGWYRFIVSNFERHYQINRAPFSFYIQEWYLSAYPAVMRALERFLDQINMMDDVFMVNSRDVIDWVKDPVPINEYRQRSCRNNQQTICPSNLCGPLKGHHNNVDYWMSVCSKCPQVYPWLDNPLGL